MSNIDDWLEMAYEDRTHTDDGDDWDDDDWGDDDED